MHLFFSRLRNTTYVSRWTFGRDSSRPQPESLMLKTLLPSVLLLVSLASVARSQDQMSARLTLSVTGVPSSNGYARLRDPFEEISSKSADAARRFAARAANIDEDSPRMCSGRRWKCVLTSALVGAGAGILIGNAIGAEPEYKTEYSIFGPYDRCVAHCQDRHTNASRFGSAGLVIGAGTSFFLTR